MDKFDKSSVALCHPKLRAEDRRAHRMLLLLLLFCFVLFWFVLFFKPGMENSKSKQTNALASYPIQCLCENEIIDIVNIYRYLDYFVSIPVYTIEQLYRKAMHFRIYISVCYFTIILFTWILHSRSSLPVESLVYYCLTAESHIPTLM